IRFPFPELNPQRYSLVCVAFGLPKRHGRSKGFADLWGFRTNSLQMCTRPWICRRQSRPVHRRYLPFRKETQFAEIFLQFCADIRPRQFGMTVGVFVKTFLQYFE